MAKTESIRIDAEYKNYIKEQARKNGRTIQGELHILIDQYRKNEERKSVDDS